MSSDPQTIHCLRATNFAVRTTSHHKSPISSNGSRPHWQRQPRATTTAADTDADCTWQLSDLEGFDQRLVVGIPYVQMTIVKVGQQPAGTPDQIALLHCAHLWCSKALNCEGPRFMTPTKVPLGADQRPLLYLTSGRIVSAAEGITLCTCKA